MIKHVEAEESVLGAILLNPKCFGSVADLLKPESFSIPKNRLIYDAMREVVNNSMPLDALTLTNELDRRGDLKDSGSFVYISDITSAVPYSANVMHYAKIVHENHKRTTLLERVRRISTLIGGDTLTDEVIAQCATISSDLEASGAKGCVHISGLVEDTEEHLLRIRHSEQGGSGVMTGIRDLDSIIWGFEPGELCILAARPSVGKSAIAINIAVNAAKANKSVMFFSLEMAHTAIIERMLGVNSRFQAWRYKQGLDGVEKDYELRMASKALKDLDIHIHDGANLTWDELRNAATSYSENHKKPDIIIIDYIQLMSIRGFKDGRQQEVSTISRCVKSLARDLKVPIIALAQLSREGGKESPQLHHLRESGSLEQDADYVILVSKTEQGQATSDNLILKLDVAKNRNGKTGKCEVLFRRNTQHIGNIQKVGHIESSPFSSIKTDYDDGEIPF